MRWALAVALVLFAAAAGRDRLDSWVDATDLPPLAITVSAEVLAADGTLLRAFAVDDGRWRLQTSLDAVDPGYIAMLLDFEDKRFYRHAGVDPRAVLRAAWQAARNGRVVSGASTLTMQVARLIENGPTGTWQGKLRQIRVALALERRLSKQQILALYLNRAPFGGNVEGVRAAALIWFGKPPTRLSADQAALLVALPQAPGLRRPDRNPDAARTARNRVLARAERTGLLAPDTARAAQAAPLPARRRDMPALAPHLAGRLHAEQPLQTVLTTTIDAAAQARMAALAHSALAGADPHLSIAIVAADYRSGAILAHVGAAGYGNDRQGFIDMSRAVRSPGSTLKPLVYALAFDAGLAHPEMLIDDIPTSFGGWSPQNFDGAFRGTLRVAEALRLSLNIPAVKLTEALGPARLMAGLRRAGTTPQLPGGQGGLAVSLGGVGLTLEDLVTLYAGLARGGEAVTLGALPRNPVQGQRITGAAAAWQVTHVLTDLAPPPGAPRRALAWKTGTSYGYRDTWAIGWDGAHVIGVWIGRPDGTPVPGAFGAELAAPVLFQAFGRLKPGFAPLPPPPPDALMVSTADLPAPLRRFGPDLRAATAGPRIAFPPDGARLAASATLAAKVRDGLPPFTWLADGAPVAISTRDRDIWLNVPGPGFVTLSVIDAAGRSARAAIRLD